MVEDRPDRRYQPVGEDRGLCRQGLGGIGQVVPAGRPLDRAAPASLSAQHAVSFHQGHGAGQGQQGADHLGRVQRCRGQDEGRRHDPAANGGNRPDDGQKFEIALAGISPEIYRRALMQLDTDALNSKEVLAAFEQLRKFANYMNPNIAAQPWAVNLPAFVKGDMGMVMTGGWAQGNLFKAGATVADFSSGPAPQDSGPPCFDLNADCFIFWKSKGADLDAGQKLFAEIVMEPSTQEMYSKITGSIPARTDVNLAAEGFTDGQRNSAQN